MKSKDQRTTAAITARITFAERQKMDQIKLALGFHTDAELVRAALQYYMDNQTEVFGSETQFASVVKPRLERLAEQTAALGELTELNMELVVRLFDYLSRSNGKAVKADILLDALIQEMLDKPITTRQKIVQAKAKRGHQTDKKRKAEQL